MDHPGKRTCDLCRNDIKPGTKQSSFALPLTLADRRVLIAEIEKHIPKHVGTMFGGAGPLAERSCPQAWIFHICMGCVEGLFPTLAELKSAQIQALVGQLHSQRERSRLEQESEAEEFRL